MQLPARCCGMATFIIPSSGAPRHTRVMPRAEAATARARRAIYVSARRARREATIHRRPPSAREALLASASDTISIHHDDDLPRAQGRQQRARAAMRQRKRAHVRAKRGTFAHAQRESAATIQRNGMRARAQRQLIRRPNEYDSAARDESSSAMRYCAKDG